MRSIIVGTDFSEGSYVALELAIDIANKINCNVSVIWVKREKILMSEEEVQNMTQVAEKKLTALCEKFSPKMNSVMTAMMQMVMAAPNHVSLNRILPA